MKLEMYAIRDVQADRSLQPMYRERENIAMRDFEQAVTETKPFCDNPDDYVLYHIGSYDDETMELKANDPRRVYGGLDAVRNRRARHIVYGHTHHAESVPLDASYAE